MFCGSRTSLGEDRCVTWAYTCPHVLFFFPSSFSFPCYCHHFCATLQSTPGPSHCPPLSASSCRGNKVKTNCSALPKQIRWHEVVLHFTKTHRKHEAHLQSALVPTSTSVRAWILCLYFVWESVYAGFYVWGLWMQEIWQTPCSLIPMSTPPPLTTAFPPHRLVSSRHTAAISAVLFLHCQGANRPWKVSIWRSSDQSLACTWKLPYVCAWNSRWPLALCAMAGLWLWGETDGWPNSLTHSGSQRPALCADVSNTSTPASTAPIQTCESDTN